MSIFDTFFHIAFRIHDWMSATLARHLFTLKKLILVGAHLSLFGFFFPEMRKDFGEIAATVLIGILFLSPVSQILRMRLLLQMMSLRREFGILMGYLATVHGVGYLIDPDWLFSLTMLFQETGLSQESAPYFFGMLAYTLTLPLLFTSNAIAQRMLGGVRWKLLHRSVYALFAVTILHRYLIQGGDMGSLLQALLLVSAYLLAKLLAYKNFLPPLVKILSYVSERYRTFTLSKRAVTPGV